jgi:hypothetical protein
MYVSSISAARIVCVCVCYVRFFKENEEDCWFPIEPAIPSEYDCPHVSYTERKLAWFLRGRRRCDVADSR